MKRLLFALPCLFFLLNAAAFGIPNFSGDWTLNTDRSDFGQLPGPDKLTQTIQHEEPNIKVVFHSVGMTGEISGEVNYTTNGKECENKVGEADMTSTLQWDGDVLKFKTKLFFQGMEIDSEEDWKLSEDGKTITINRFMTSTMGELYQTLVMEKQ